MTRPAEKALEIQRQIDRQELEINRSAVILKSQEPRESWRHPNSFLPK